MAQSQVANFEYIARLKFASIVRYSTIHNPDEVLEPNYFKNSAQYLEAGDNVDVVCRHEDGSWSKGTLEVATKTPTDIAVVLVGKWHVGGDAVARNMTKHYIPGNTTWTIKDDAGRVVAKGLNKAEAEAMLGETSASDKKAA